MNKRLTCEWFISILPDMKIRILLNDELLKATKALASETGRMLTDVVEGALREEIARHQRKQKKTRIRLTTARGKGLLRRCADADAAENLALFSAGATHDLPGA